MILKIIILKKLLKNIFQITQQWYLYLKIIYEDLWKDYNQINTSIRFPLLVKVNNKNFDISSKFEKSLSEIDLIGKYSINKFDSDYIYYEILFNGSPNNFLNIMKNRNYNFDTQKKVWVLNE